MPTLVDQDEEYGTVGLGRIVMAAADTYGVVSIDDIIEPTIIYDIKVSGNKVQTEITNILVWDVREFLPRLGGAEPPVTSHEDDVTSAHGGIYSDDSLDKTGYPATQGASGPDGAVASTAGLVAGTLNVTTPSASTGFVTEWEWFRSLTEEQDATGQITFSIDQLPKNRVTFSPYGRNITRHNMLTRANYYLWMQSTNLSSVVAETRLGMDARLMAIDLEEMLADRGVILNLADALTILTI